MLSSTLARGFLDILRHRPDSWLRSARGAQLIEAGYRMVLKCEGEGEALGFRLLTDILTFTPLSLRSEGAA